MRNHAVFMALAASAVLLETTPLRADSAGCTIRVAAGDDLGEVVRGAPDGAVLCLGRGRFELGAVISRSLTLRGLGSDATKLSCPEDPKQPAPLVVVDTDGTGCGPDPCPRVGEPFTGVIMVKAGAAGLSPSLVIEDLSVADCDAGALSPVVAAGLKSGQKARLTVRRTRFSGNRKAGKRPAGVFGYLSDVLIEDTVFDAGGTLRELRSFVRGRESNVVLRNVRVNIELLPGKP